MIENFVSLDFETAKPKYPCSVGLVVFENGFVVDKYYSLINPEIDEFNKFHQRKHGISKEDVINEKAFPEVWGEIEKYFQNTIIIGHNFSTENSILKFMAETYNLSLPVYKAYCTLNLSKKILDIDNYKLSTVANFLGVSQKHYHHALDDALVCGNVFLKLFENGLNIKDINQFGQNIKRNSSNQFYNHNEWKQKQKNNERVRDELFFANLLNNKTDILQGKTFVISGVFTKVSRDELKKLIENNGGKVSSSISSKTSYVVAGENMGPSKLQKAESLGVPIISEDRFLDMIA